MNTIILSTIAGAMSVLVGLVLICDVIEGPVNRLLNRIWP
jgi:hypothetical protein